MKLHVMNLLDAQWIQKRHHAIDGVRIDTGRYAMVVCQPAALSCVTISDPNARATGEGHEPTSHKTLAIDDEIPSPLPERHQPLDGTPHNPWPRRPLRQRFSWKDDDLIEGGMTPDGILEALLDDPGDRRLRPGGFQTGQNRDGPTDVPQGTGSY